MKRILEKIHKEIVALNEANEKLWDEYERLENWEKDIENRKTELDAETMSEEDYNKKMEELDKEKKIYEEANEKYNKDNDAYNEKIDKVRKEILENLSYKKSIVEKYMEEDLKQFDMKALREERKKLEDILALSKISGEEFNKLDSKKQEEVLQARKNSYKNRKRLYEIKDIMNYVRTVSKRNPEDVLGEINYVIGEVDENFRPGMTIKLADLETKLNELDSKDIKKKPENEKGKEKDKGKADKDESEDKKGPISYKEAERKIENNNKRIEEILKTMRQPMKDTVKYAEYLIELRELQAENKELLKIIKPKDKEQGTKDNKSQGNNKDNSQQSEDIGNKPENSNENKETRIEYIRKDIEKYKQLIKKYQNDPAKCEDFKNAIKKLEMEKEQLEDQISGKTPEQKTAETRDRLMNRMRENQINILKLMKTMDKYKNDPEKYNACAKKIKEIQNTNKMIYEALFPEQLNKDGRQTQQTSLQQPQKDGKEVEPKNVIYIGQKKERPQIKFDVKNGVYTYINEYGNALPYDFFSGKEKSTIEDGIHYEVITKEREEKLMKDAIQRGLTKRQAKKIDFRIYVLLLQNNGELLRNYIDSFKNNKEFDVGFDAEYDLRRRNKKIIRDIGRKNIRSISRKAKNASKLGIAKMYKDKIRVGVAAIWTAIGLTAAGGTGYIALDSGIQQNANENKSEQQQNIDENKNIEETIKNFKSEDIDQKSNEDTSNGFKNNYKVNVKEQDSQEKEQQNNEVTVTVDMDGNTEEIAENQNIVDMAMNGYYTKNTSKTQHNNTKQQANIKTENKEGKQQKGKITGLEGLEEISELDDISAKAGRKNEKKNLNDEMKVRFEDGRTGISDERRNNIVFMDENSQISANDVEIDEER